MKIGFAGIGLLVSHSVFDISSMHGNLGSRSMTNPMPTRYITSVDWRDWRMIRLRSLLEDPDAFGSTYDRESQFDDDAWRSRLNGKGGPAVLAYEDDKPVGMGAGWLYKPGCLMVVAMWTEPASRGKGVGLDILSKVLDWSHKHSLQSELWVSDSKPASRRLYERYGFRHSGETALLREDTTLTMSRFLLPTETGSTEGF